MLDLQSLLNIDYDNLEWIADSGLCIGCYC